tara:strand:+ start:3053 stop:4762 length:1710 start_codon:yes stop_codon:yes gene_type:complete
MIIFHKVRWKNFLSTGDVFTEIELDRNDATLIVGHNGSGKSTLLDALTFGLFGRPFRKINKPQLVNSVNGSGLVVEVDFTIGKKMYMVRRGIKPNFFEILVDGVLLNQDAKMKDYQEKLESILKLNYKSFTQIIVLGSSSFQPFMQLPLSHRREIIEDLLGIQIFSAMNVLLKEKVAENKSMLAQNKTKIDLNREKKSMLDQYIKDTEEINNNKIGEIEKSIKETNSSILSSRKKIDSYQIQKEGFVEKTVGYDTIQKEFTELTNYGNDIKSKISNNQRMLNLVTNHSQCPVCEQGIPDEYKSRIGEEKEEIISGLESGLQQLSVELDTRKSKLSEIDSVNSQITEINSTVLKEEHTIHGMETYLNKLSNDIQYLIKVREKSQGDSDRLREISGEYEELFTVKDELLEERNYFSVISDLLRDDGIKTVIIRQYLPIMNKLINKYLTSMDSYFNFTLDENFAESIKSRKRDTFSYDSFSEGEKMRIDLALLFTWRDVAKLKNSANTNLLVLDEVFDSSLDSSGTEEFMKLLNTMLGDANIFVISHKGDALQERFENILGFEKIGNFSKVV